MGKSKFNKKLKQKLRQLTMRDALMVVFGAAVTVIGFTMASAFEPKPTTVPLAPRTKGITISWVPESVKRWNKPVEQMAQKYNIDPNLLAIIMTLESGGNPKAQSGVGAQGLMQIMPLTAQDIAIKYLKEPRKTYDIYDPATNIEFGAAYLAYLRDEFGEAQQGPSWNTTVELVAAGYNGGPGAAGHLLRGHGLESTETLSYSRDAYNMWRERKSDASPTFNRWLERGGSSLVEKAK